ncbi:hypothetical protein CAF53_18700 [Sphingobium sp. LB126]|uniref:PDR/VanB family oxidoreductase n=1 Tax=Sphingobium sp. LB126 TaxID=1983755 RepID=UPI000C20B3A7|nr:PDR/VanB family oxidoreductase [Sphingobium sp. LB126]PJG46745.1 hypothetical protein CAF53_18700 [Sphingobium sp. LB126]
MQKAEDLVRARIVQKRLEADDIVSVLLRGEGSGPLPSHEAGAHIDLHLGEGVIRQYSLCPSSGKDGEYEVAVLREPQSRGGSRAVHDLLQVGQVIDISVPRNHFPLKSCKGKVLLFAGGIGITPILAMAEECVRRGQPFSMHYCARSADRMAYARRISEGAVGPHCQLHYDDGPDSQKLDLAAVLQAPGPDDALYVCGPAGFINWVLETAAANGWTEAQLNREFFAAPEIDAGQDSAFTVRLARTGRDVQVAPGVSIVEALDAEGVMVPVSCSEGICGMCVVSVLDGEPEHRDFVLSAEEHARNDCLTACCSRAKTPVLVLDL